MCSAHTQTQLITRANPSEYAKLTKLTKLKKNKSAVQLVWPCTRCRGTPTPPWIPIAQRLSWNEKTKGIRQVGCHTKVELSKRSKVGFLWMKKGIIHKRSKVKLSKRYKVQDERNYTQKVECGATWSKAQLPLSSLLCNQGYGQALLIACSLLGDHYHLG